MSAAGLADAQTSQPAGDRESSPATNGKRKRDEEIVDDNRAAKIAIPQDELYSLADDLLLILKSSYSFALDILTRPILSTANHDPTAKRAKLSSSPSPQKDRDEAPPAAAKTTIQEQLEAKTYHDLDGLAADFDLAVDDFVQHLESSDGERKSESSPDLRSDNALQARLLQSEVRLLLGVEKKRHGEKDALSAVGKDGFSNGFRPSDARAQKQSTEASPANFVLTIFGADYKGRGVSKQWFASRQDASHADTQASDPVETAFLPNGVVPTLMQSMSKPAIRKPAPKQKLGELVPTPSQVLALRPPRPLTAEKTRSQVVEWYKPSEDPPMYRPRNKDSWINMAQPTGAWLSYSSNADIEESSAEKRMKRNRTLSGGERPDAAEVEFLQQSKLSRARAKKSSLFRSAFSSFAPSYDDTGAIVPAAAKARLWWTKAGSQIYDRYEHPEESAQTLEEQLQALDPQLRDSEERVTEEELKIIEDTLEAGDLESSLQEYEGDSTTANAEDLLEGISENIETLINYQRDRMKVIPAPGKPSTIQHPSAAEEEIYETLKLSLASIVAMLPPAALSRLDGDKLKRLDISTQIPVDIPSSSGTFDMTDKSQPSRPPLPTANRSSFSGTSTPQQPRTAQQPRSAYAHQPSIPLSRPAMPPQYSVPQPGRFANTYTGANAQGSPLPNGYPRPMTNNFSQSQYSQYNNSPASTPSRPGNQYPGRPAAGFQPRAASYQMINPPKPTAPNAAGRAGSPQRPASYNLPPSRTPYGPVPNAPMSAGHAASVYRPPSNGGPANQGPQGTIGALVDITPEEQQQISRRTQEKQQQDPLGPATGSPRVAQKTSQPSTPQHQNQQRPPAMVNGVAQGSPSKMQGVQQADTLQATSKNPVNGA